MQHRWLLVTHVFALLSVVIVTLPFKTASSHGDGYFPPEQTLIESINHQPRSIFYNDSYNVWTKALDNTICLKKKEKE